MAREAGLGLPDSGMNVESSLSAVTWSAVLAGAFTAAATSLLLVTLGSGIGMASISPWSNEGATATTFTIAAAIWLIIVQWLSSGLGGYITGRLRTKWANLHSDEVFFRDTAHGFLSWAVASLVVVGLVASSTTSLVGSAGQAAGGIAASVAGGAGQGVAEGVSQGGFNPSGYYVDSIFRSDKPGSNASDQDVKAEASRIILMGLKNGSVSDSDKAYLGQIVAARTGMSQDEAVKRVNDVLNQVQAAETKAKQAADQTRKATSQASFFLFFSMLIGAFIASVAAALGGRQRDEL